MTCTLDYFKIIRKYEPRRVRIITDDAQLRMRVLFGGTHDRGAYASEHYAFSYFYPIPDTDQGHIIKLDSKDFEMMEAVE